jgi:hypothetical protein
LNGCDGEEVPWTNHFTDNTMNIPPGGMFVKDKALIAELLPGPRPLRRELNRIRKNSP